MANVDGILDLLPWFFGLYGGLTDCAWYQNNQYIFLNRKHITLVKPQKTELLGFYKLNFWRIADELKISDSTG